MENLEQIKKLFLVEGKERTGFDERVYKAIKVSLDELDKRFLQKISSQIIVDNHSFVVDKDATSRTLSNIYLNRLIKNVKQIIYDNNSVEKGYYDASTHTIYINPSKIDDALLYYNTGNLSQNQLQNIENKLFISTLQHMLEHASVDNGVNTGYYPPRTKQDILAQYKRLYPTTEYNISMGASKLEEIFAQHNAIIRTGKMLVHSVYGNVIIPEYSPEIESACIQSFAEFIGRSIPNIEMARYVDPLKFLASLDNTYSLPNQNNKLFSVALNNVLKDIVDTRNVQDGLDSLVELQRFFLEIYDINVLSNKNQIFDKAFAYKVCNDLITFDILLVRDKTTKTANVLKLEEIKTKALELARQNNIDLIAIANIEADNIVKDFMLDSDIYNGIF